MMKDIELLNSSGHSLAFHVHKFVIVLTINQKHSRTSATSELGIKLN